MSCKGCSKELFKNAEQRASGLLVCPFIRGIQGELYPIKKDIFAETYDVVE